MIRKRNMTGKKLTLKVFFILFIIAAGIFPAYGSVLAQGPQFRLDIDSLNLQTGVSTNLVLSMTDAKGAEVEEISGLENFDVISSGSSTVTQIINGATTYREDINYVIMPKSEGEFTLRGSVKYNGKAYETNELQINVSPANKNNTEEGEAEDLFVKTILSANEIYFGQKVVLAYELYTRYNIENFGFLNNTCMNGFISSDMPEDNLKAEIVYLNGEKYARYEVKQTILSPVKAGTYTIPAYNFQVNVSTGNLFNSSKPVYLQTESKELAVKPLPSENQPADFSGLVGELKLESKYSKQEVDYGDSLTLQVTASGNCSLDHLEEIVKGDLPGFSVYQTEKNAGESVENYQYAAKKEFEVILVPKENGNIKIDPISIPYFNPESGSYEQAEIPGATVTVKGEIPQLPQAQGEVKNEAPAIETVKIDRISYSPQNEGYLTIQLKKDHLFMGLAVLAALLVFTALALWLVSCRKKYDGKLQEIYRQLNRQFKSKDPKENQNEIYNLFNSMIKHCFNLSLKASSRDMIASRLAKHELAAPVLEIMDYMENGKYRSDEGNGYDNGNIYLKTKIKQVYRTLKELSAAPRIFDTR